MTSCPLLARMLSHADRLRKLIRLLADRQLSDSALFEERAGELSERPVTVSLQESRDTGQRAGREIV